MQRRRRLVQWIPENRPTGSGRRRWLGAGLSVVLGLVSTPGRVRGAEHFVPARGETCLAAPQVWAEALTEQLPLFLNLALSRSRSEFQVVLVGKPEVEMLSPGSPARLRQQELAPVLPDTATAVSPEAFRLYFTTLERRLVLPQHPQKEGNSLAGRRSETLQLAYEAYVLRATPGDPWQLVRLQVTGAGVPVRDVTEGLTAQAIRRWQEAGCPLTGDLELTRPTL